MPLKGSVVPELQQRGERTIDLRVVALQQGLPGRGARTCRDTQRILKGTLSRLRYCDAAP
ncbi:hypothetical protein E2C01_006148 [Portunus trituberculatus]|uniref:Uncharacterized protein n=1 Tax=Portunus trituberculatus TaxID=210409 RepID=A0A5B7CWB3_PORTR|nr:hypothetical protein [Portunus trituberculatus]